LVESGLTEGGTGWGRGEEGGWEMREGKVEGGGG